MSLSTLPLCYCTNVHPAQSLHEVETALSHHTRLVQQHFGEQLAAGLWLAKPVVGELIRSPNGIARFAEQLRSLGLSCHTLNAFPFGDFHQQRVKENVYLPDWSTPARTDYTVRCAAVLAGLLLPGTEGSISTVPLGFKGFDHAPDFLDVCAANLIQCAVSLDRLRQETGRMVRLAVEPEPFCVLETTAEAVAFFRRLWQLADDRGYGDIVREHVGLCFDICHQAVEFEDVSASVRAFDAAGVRINKVHISCALRLDHPADNPDGLAALRSYAEPRYLHQTFGRLGDGRLVRAVDLTDDLLADPGPEFLAADEWRVHFHVPIDADRLGPLRTTRPALGEALTAVAALSYAPHLEVETYTWAVLPGQEKPPLVEGLARELNAAQSILAGIDGSSPAG